VALVVPNLTAVRHRAHITGLTLDEPLMQSGLVRDVVQRELDERSQSFAAYERPKKCYLVEDFTVENGLLTPTLKLRRAAIVERYARELEAMYRDAQTPKARPHAPLVG
jgi:long-chain acyl-CoA synthetase